jgi:ParB family chromosome partitioning protein
VSGSGNGTQVERTVESIIVGRRHRQNLGDLTALVASIRDQGLLQPITVTTEGFLICGARRLAAVKQLGWRTLTVWVRSGISDELGRLLAEQDDNSLHKPLDQIEGAALYREVKAMLAEDAARRMQASQFQPGSNENPRSQGSEDSSEPWNQSTGDAREQAARMVTGRLSFQTFERVNRLQDIAADESQPEQVRLRAAQELQAIEAGGSVNASHLRMNTVLSLADLDQMAADPALPVEVRAQAAHDAAEVRAAESATRAAELEQLAKEALARAKANAAAKAKGKRPKPSITEPDEPAQYSTRAFITVWGELDGWWLHYRVEQLAREVPEAHWQQFKATAHGTITILNAVDQLRGDLAAQRSI